MTNAIFIADGDVLTPTAMAGSPWTDEALHGGPVNGLLARAVERFAAEPEMHVVRLTVDLFRQVPKAPLTTAVRSLRRGRRIHVVEAFILADGVEVSRATAVLLRTSAPAKHIDAIGATATPPGPDGIETTGLSIAADSPTLLSRRPGFHTTIEARWVRRPSEPGAATAWLRLPAPFVAGEETGPLVRAAAIADFANPLASGGSKGQTGFINVDCTLYLHREPCGEWLCLEVTGALDPAGVGVSHAVLYDSKGPAGRITQALLANQAS